MAEMSYLQIHDANDTVLNHFNRNHHQRRRHHQSISQILDSLPHWIQSDDYLSQSDFPSEGLDLLERRSFVMDLFHQRVEQSQVSPLDDDYESAGSDHENRDNLELDFDCELGLESGRVFVDCDEEEDDDEEDLFDRIRYLGIDSGDVVVTVESGSDCDDVEEEEDEYVNDDEEDDDNVTIPLCWDSLHLEDNDEFEWEEVHDDDDDEREVLAEGDDNNSVSVSVSATISQEDLATGERRGYLGWEVLLNSRSLEFNLDDAESNMELYIGDIDQQEDDEDYLHTTEYEMLFEAEISSGLGKPPASKSFIKNLKVTLLTEEDVDKEDGDDDDAMCCAICREEMNVGKEVAELPCRHKYHGECIVPWLGIRNTCPVCRFELPSDETVQSRF